MALLASVHCNGSLGLAQGLWLPLHHQYWPLTESPLSYPSAALSHGDPAALVLQDHSHQVLQHGVDIRTGQLKALNLGLSRS